MLDLVLVNQCCLPGNNGLNSRSGPHGISTNVALLKGGLLRYNDFSKQCLPVKTCDRQFWQLRSIQYTYSRQSIARHFTLVCCQKWHCGARSTSRNPYRIETSKLSQQPRSQSHGLIVQDTLYAASYVLALRGIKQQ